MSVDDLKDEVERLLGCDFEPGDQLKRIRQPSGWPEETVTVEAVLYNPEIGCTMLHLQGPISKSFRTASKNIGIMYERVRP